MDRLALYRKYRSADFDQVIGQDHVTKTLQAAMKKGQISHAYLFTGPRGVGKTSVARILAKRVNKISDDTDMSSVLDVVEIDAASNRGIDEIRSLREKISAAPTSLKYKVYIIDEVHMLTKEAFNALLKTLEEPPSHAIFILATTEAHKLPDTVISRTQRFDFHPIGHTDIINHLENIAKKEKINVTKGSLKIIATSSQGGFRDAISLLDQLSAFEGKIDENLVYEMLGLSDQNEIFALISSVYKKEPKDSLKTLNNILNKGVDPINLTNQILEFLRNGLIEKGGLAETSNTKAFDDFDLDFLVQAIEHLTKALADFKITNHYCLPLELAIYKLAHFGKKNKFIQEDSIVKEVRRELNADVKNKGTKPGDNDDYSAKISKAFSQIKQRNNSLYALMRSSNPAIKNNSLVLKCKFRFHQDRLEEDKNRRMIEEIMSKALGKSVILKCQLDGRDNDNKNPIDQNNELVSSALEILGGEIVNG